MSFASQEVLSGIAVGTIAQDIAYENEKAFSRAFKQIYGIAPMEYRKSHNLLLS
jgi:AraC-like DNA-binding protein